MVVVVVAVAATVRKDRISDKEWSVGCVSMTCEYLAVFSVNEAAPLFSSVRYQLDDHFMKLIYL